MQTSGGVSSNQYINMKITMPSPLQAMAAHCCGSRCKGLQFNGTLTREWLYALSNTIMVSHLSGSFSPRKSSTLSSADYILKHYMTSIYHSLIMSLLLPKYIWKQLLPMTFTEQKFKNFASWQLYTWERCLKIVSPCDSLEWLINGSNIFRRGLLQDGQL